MGGTQKRMEKFTIALDLDNKKIVYDGCMLTVSNILIDLYNPNPETIFIEDIAHGLANNCRWNGHTQKFWSVAQHCCMMYDLEMLQWEFENIIKNSNADFWLPERAKKEFLIRFNSRINN